MKIRAGFVSNSSSSSFCAIMYSGDKIKEMMKHLEIKPDPTWEEMSRFEEYNYGRYCIPDTDMIIFWYNWANEIIIGMEVADLLYDDMTVKQCKEVFIKEVLEEFQIKLSPKEVTWEYRDWSNGS